MAEFDWAALIGGVLQAAAIGGGVVFAGRQVRVSADQNKDAERWRRIEFATSLTERLSTDEELALCARALDWGVGPLMVPAKYRVLFAEARRKQTSAASPAPSSLDDAPSVTSEGDWGPIESDAQFTHNWARLARAVRPGLDRDWNDPRMLVYRYCFDAFGEYLEVIQRHIDLQTAEPAHLIGLRYYLNLLVEPEYYRGLPNKITDESGKDVEAKDVFRPFMQNYYADGWHLVENRHKLPSAR
jgi:hypothetical protein